MGTSEPDEVTYTDKQVSAILRRATELQSDDTPVGTTLESIKLAASELGIAPAVIERAAMELVHQSSSASEDDLATRLAGGPWNTDTLRIVPRVSAEAWPAIVERIRSASGRVGYPKQVGTGYEWLSQRPEPIHVTITPRGNTAELRVRAWFGHWALAFYMIPASLALTIAMFAMLLAGGTGAMSPGSLAAIVIGCPATGAILGRIAAGRFFKKRCAWSRVLAAQVEKAIVDEMAVSTEPLANSGLVPEVTSRYQLEPEEEPEALLHIAVQS